MKWKSVLCVAALALVAGCKSEQNPYASFGEYGFTYDLVQYPVPGLTQAEAERIAQAPSVFNPPTPVMPVIVMTPVPVKPAVIVEPTATVPATPETPAVVTPVTPITPAPIEVAPPAPPATAPK